MSPARRLFFASLFLDCSGCTTAPEERPPVLPAPTASVASVVPIAPIVPTAPLPLIAPLALIAAPGAAGPLAPVRTPVRLLVEESVGAETARVRAALAAAEPRVGECVPGSGGVIRLRVASGPDGARFTIERSSLVGRRSRLGPRQRRCVLEALSTVDVPSATADASPSARPSGFTALFRIEW
jgi:hypothetical protein